jgi:hypothetical protein
LIINFEGDLVIPQVIVEEAQETASHRGVHDLIDSEQVKKILFAGMVEISIINTHPPIFILF